MTNRRVDTRKADRQTDKKKQSIRQTDDEIGRHTDNLINKHTGRQVDRHIGKQADKL